MTAGRTGRASGAVSGGSYPPAAREAGVGPRDNPAGRLRSGHLLGAIVCALDKVFAIELKRLTASSPIRSFAKPRAFELSEIGKCGFQAVLLVSDDPDADRGADAPVTRSMPKTLELNIYGRDDPVRVSVSPCQYYSSQAQRLGTTPIRRADFTGSGMDLAVLIFRD